MSASELARIRECDCALVWEDPCLGVTTAHHHTGHRGLSRKSNDRRTFPLCAKHHDDFHTGSGYFSGWSKEERRIWQDVMVERYWPDEVDGQEMPF